MPSHFLSTTSLDHFRRHSTFSPKKQDGQIYYFDARAGAASKPLFHFSAHSKPATCLSFSPLVPGLLLTASTDKKTSLWKVENNTPSPLASTDLKVGAVFSAGFCRDSAFLVAAGGAKGTVSIWETTTEGHVVEYAKSKGVGVELTELAKSAKRRENVRGSDGSDSETESDTDSD